MAPEKTAARSDAAKTGWRRRLSVLGGSLLVLLVLDLTRAPAHQLTAGALIAGIHTYRAVLSPISALVGARCRFEPSCSHYAEAVIRNEGALFGSLRALGRIARCGPWTPRGTADPPGGSTSITG